MKNINVFLVVCALLALAFIGISIDAYRAKGTTLFSYLSTAPIALLFSYVTLRAVINSLVAGVKTVVAYIRKKISKKEQE